MNRDQQRNDANLKHPPASPVAAQCFHVNTTPQADTERCLAAPGVPLKLKAQQRMCRQLSGQMGYIWLSGHPCSGEKNPFNRTCRMSESKRNFSEMYGHQFEDLSVGMSASLSRTVSEADILMSAGVSGDNNPVHMDEEFAASTMFGGRIAHGMLSAGLISAVFGTRLPGPGSIYLSQNLKFKAPVRIGQTLVATVTVKELKAEKRRVVFSTVCTCGETVVIDGEAELMLPLRS